MRIILLFLMLTLTSASANAQVQFFDYDLTLTMGLPVVGFMPGVAVRPEGDVQVRDISKGERFTRAILSSRFWVIRNT